MNVNALWLTDQTHRACAVLALLCHTCTPKNWERDIVARYRCMLQKALFNALWLCDVPGFEMTLSATLDGFSFVSGETIISEVLDLDGDCENIKTFKCRIMFQSFCRNTVWILRTFQTFYALSCALSWLQTLELCKLSF